MRKKLVYICSPCRGDVEKNIEKARATVAKPSSSGTT